MRVVSAKPIPNFSPLFSPSTLKYVFIQGIKKAKQKWSEMDGDEWESESPLTSFNGHRRPFSAHGRLHTNWTLSTLGEVAAPKISGWSSANLLPQICHKIRSTPNLNWRQFFGSAHPNGGRQVCGKMELVCLFVSPHLESALGSQVHVSLVPFPTKKSGTFMNGQTASNLPFFASSTTLAAIK